MLRIGPSGNSNSFYESGNKHTYQAAKWLSELGLNAYEYSFGRGVHIGDETAEKIAVEMKKYDVALSVHAPYFTNFANPDPEMIEKSVGYIVQSLVAMKKMGGNRTVFHPAAVGKVMRAEAVATAHKNIEYLVGRLKSDLSFNDYILCPETMGKHGQVGTVEEIIEFCKLDEYLYPCFDFGHINSYTQGALKTKDDFKRIIDLTINELGEERGKNFHVHFSKIQYGNSGEIRHLTFADEVYGPEYAPLGEIIDEYALTPTIICESKECMAEDALIMKNYHKNG